MSLFASGRTTGTVLDSGYGKTHSVPIFEGYPIPISVQTIPFSGRDISSYLLHLLEN
jgi:actin beta/gamma 1